MRALHETAKPPHRCPPPLFVARSPHPAEAANIINGIIFRAFSGACPNLNRSVCRVEHAMRFTAAKSLFGLRNYRCSGTNCGGEMELGEIIIAAGNLAARTLAAPIRRKVT
jgi:hypothetical protein